MIVSPNIKCPYWSTDSWHRFTLELVICYSFLPSFVFFLVSYEWCKHSVQITIPSFFALFFGWFSFKWQPFFGFTFRGPFLRCFLHFIFSQYIDLVIFGRFPLAEIPLSQPKVAMFNQSRILFFFCIFCNPSLIEPFCPFVLFIVR